jgi:type VI secretion system secreted protein VgrG
VTAAGAVQLSNGETVSLMSGADTQLVSGGQMRVHSGQAIGVLGGAVAPDADGMGVQMIAAKDVIDVQAHADTLTVQARDDVNVISANAFIDFAAAKSISLSTAGGANITIDGGNITVQCPGKIGINAGKKTFEAPERLSFQLPVLPAYHPIPAQLHFDLRLADTPGPEGHALCNTPWKIASGEMPAGLAIVEPANLIASGDTDNDGRIVLNADQLTQVSEQYRKNPSRTWLLYPGHVVRLNIETVSSDWTPVQAQAHAIAAADFSGDLHRDLTEASALAQSYYAKAAYMVTALNDVVKKVIS